MFPPTISSSSNQTLVTAEEGVCVGGRGKEAGEVGDSYVECGTAATGSSPQTWGTD